MTVKYLITALFVILLLSSGCSRFGGVESPTGHSEVRPKVFMDILASTPIPKDQEFAISVYAENVTNLYGVNIYISYDPAKLTYVSSTEEEGNFLNEGDFLKLNDFITQFFHYEVTSSILNIAMTRYLNPNKQFPPDFPKVGVSGTGTLCTVKFKAIASTGDTGTVVKFLNEAPLYLGFWDSNLTEIEKTVGGKITVYIQ